MDRDAQDVPLDGAEPVGRPAGLLGCGGDPPVELGRVAHDGSRHVPGVRVDLTLVQLARRPLGDVPLVQERQGGLARLAAAPGH